MSIHDRWGGNKRGDGKRWEVRYRSANDRQVKRRFANLDAAKAADAERQVAPTTKRAAEGKALTVDALMAKWLATKGGLKPKTLDAYALDAREVTDTFGGRLARSVDPSEVLVWVARPRGVSLRRRSLTAFSQAYRIAVRDGLLTASPCVGARLPAAAQSERRALTWSELERLAAESGPHAPLVWLLGTVGLRLGEAIGLQVGDVDPYKGRIRVARSVVDTSHGRSVGTPKSGKGRDVAVPRFVLEQLPLTVPGVDGGYTVPRASDAWLFLGAYGGRLDGPSWRRQNFEPAALRAGLGHLVPHELRHTAASLAIADGADVMAVQRMLGHASPAITLSIYSHMWESGIDAVAERMNRRGVQE